MAILADKTAQKIHLHWDEENAMTRFKLIMRHSDLFWSLGLVTRSELEVAAAMSESNLEYVITREDQPIFESLHLKREMAAQIHRKKLEAALKTIL